MPRQNFSTAQLLQLQLDISWWEHLTIHSASYQSHLTAKRLHAGKDISVWHVRGADCNTGSCQVVWKHREGLLISTQTSTSYTTRKLRKGIRQNLDKNVDMNWTWESITQNIKTKAEEILGYCELKQHKAGFDKVRSKLLDQGKYCDASRIQTINLNGLKSLRNETNKYCNNNKWVP